MTAPARAPIHDRLTALADATRCRLLLALEAQAMTVGELCAALQLPQSTVSRHLRVLADDGWVTSRADGASRWYAMPQPLDASRAPLWQAVRGEVAATPGAAQDAARVAAVVAERRTRSQAYFDGAAAEWDATRAHFLGDRHDLLAAFALLDPDWTVADLGCGTGVLTAALAPFVREAIGVDGSAAMCEAARDRVAGASNARIVEGQLEALPLAAASLDAALLMLVLHHLADPVAVLREARRVLAPDGRLVVCDLLPHEREAYRERMGHVRLGIDAPTLTEWAVSAGFAPPHVVALPVDPAVEGPALFTATLRPAAAETPSGARSPGDAANPSA